MRRRGMSILEVLFAMYFLTITVLAVLNLYQAALQGGAKSDQRVRATTIAEKHLARLRVWATNSTNWADWSVIDGVTTRDDEFSDYEVTIDSEPYTQLSPCTSLEEAWVPGERREMTSTLRKARVQVRWGPPAAPSRVQVTSLISGPRAELEKVEITPDAVPNPIGRDQLGQFSAVGQEGDETPIPDLFLEWTILPGTGNGSLKAARSGVNATFEHRYLAPPALVLYYPTGSQCKVQARAVYRGIERVKAYNVTLSDP